MRLDSATSDCGEGARQVAFDLRGPIIIVLDRGIARREAADTRSFTAPVIQCNPASRRRHRCGLIPIKNRRYCLPKDSCRDDRCANGEGGGTCTPRDPRPTVHWIGGDFRRHAGDGHDRRPRLRGSCRLAPLRSVSSSRWSGHRAGRRNDTAHRWYRRKPEKVKPLRGL